MRWISGQQIPAGNHADGARGTTEPGPFFRVSRNLLVNIDAIRKVHTWLGGRLKLDLHPPMNGESLVSRERVNDFKEWLGRWALSFRLLLLCSSFHFLFGVSEYFLHHVRLAEFVFCPDLLFFLRYILQTWRRWLLPR